MVEKTTFPRTSIETARSNRWDQPNTTGPRCLEKQRRSPRCGSPMTNELFLLREMTC